ncbi:MAG: Acetyltransferase family, partial [Deltaproteobacteria bacterium]|nr:Acetyltransferase family [Deltaproteobacteria bacterium]
MTIRAAEPGDAAAIVAIIRAPFDPAVIETFIYGCSGIDRYIAATIEARDTTPDTRFFVAGEPVSGAIEMRILPDCLFLNYIAVDGSARGQHVGTRLLRHAIDQLAHPTHARLSLDVLDSNHGARDWYAKLGMERVSRASWYTGALPHGSSSPATIGGLPQARVCQREFGFSR